GPFSKAPLRLWKLDGGKYAGTYCIEQRHGGPALAISMPICKKLDGVIWHLRRGELYYQKHYFDDASQQWLRPSDELKAWHAALVKRIKPALKRTRIDKELWIGKHALSLLQRGEALIQVYYGEWLDFAGNVVKSDIPQQPMETRTSEDTQKYPE